MPDTVGSRLAILGASALERWHGALSRFRPDRGFVRTWVSPADASSRLVMSEWFVIAALALSLIWSMSAALYPAALGRIVGHLFAPVLLVGAGLSLAGRPIFASGSTRASRSLTPARLIWPLLLLALMILGGSIYTRFSQGVAESFIGMGGYMLAAYLVAAVVATSGNPVRLVTVYFLLLVCTGVVSLGVAASVFFEPALFPFHELEFLIVPLIVYIATRKTELTIGELLLVWAGAASAVLFRKNTGYLVGLGVLAYLWLFHWRATYSRVKALRRLAQALASGIVVSMILAGYLALRRFKQGFVPTGNLEFRLHMYELAWNRFLESPIWGTLFSERAVEKFTLYDTGRARNLLPIHSNLLDLLAHGGLIAIILLVLAYWLLMRAVSAHILSRRESLDPHVVALAHTFLCMTLLGAVSFTFNPLLLNPSRAMVIWGQFGLLAGLACHCAHEPGGCPRE